PIPLGDGSGKMPAARSRLRQSGREPGGWLTTQGDGMRIVPFWRQRKQTLRRRTEQFIGRSQDCFSCYSAPATPSSRDGTRITAVLRCREDSYFHNSCGVRAVLRSIAHYSRRRCHAYFLCAHPCDPLFAKSLS